MVLIKGNVYNTFFAKKNIEEVSKSLNLGKNEKHNLSYNYAMRRLDLFLFYKLWMMVSGKGKSDISFYMAKFPVTNIEYSRFIEETDHSTPRNWIEGCYPVEKSYHPVTSIRKRDAVAYCKWCILNS